MNKETQSIVQLIRSDMIGFAVSGKVGKSKLQPRIAQVLSASGYDVDREDMSGFFPAGLPAWRDKTTGAIVATTARRRIDLVIRKHGSVVCLIETESDLNDLREHGVSGRSDHYDVFSMARSAAGAWFDSYKSLERMAAAAWYATGRREDALADLRSDLAEDHNPARLGLILVTGSSRALDRRILSPRLKSLGANLVSVTAR